MTAFPDVYPHVPQSPSPRPDRITHRASRRTGGHPLMPDTGHHALPRKARLLPYLAAVLLPLAGVLLVLFALGLYGQPPVVETVPPVVQVSVSPSACTFPDGT